MTKESNDVYGYIYVTIDLMYNKVYVGQRHKLPEHDLWYFGSGKVIRNIKRVRGTQFFKKVILGLCYSKEELDTAERECIRFFQSTDRKYGYNISEGGLEYRIMRGADNGMYQRGHTARARLKMSNLKKLIIDRYKGENNPSYGIRGDNSPTALLYEITFPDGHKEIIRGLTNFCNEHGLDLQHMYKVIWGKRNHHKGFKVKKHEDNCNG
jgi:hypothetical protein